MYRRMIVFILRGATIGFASFVTLTVDPSAADDESQKNKAGLYGCLDHKDKIERQCVHLTPTPGQDLDERDGRLLLPSVSSLEDIFYEPAHQVARQDTPQTWTFLFYDDADFPNAYDPFVDFAADARSRDNVNVVVLQDVTGGPANVWYINRSQAVVHEASWFERNMGDPSTLRNFICWAKNNYPADRYLLAVYDHGGGWQGACADVTNVGWMTMDDIRAAVSAAGNVDIICFTAPCLMGAVESAYELRDCVDIYIGSEDLSGYAYWRGIMGDICAVLNDSSHLSNEDIGKTIIHLFATNREYPFGYRTMSAVKASSVAGIVKQVKTFSQYAIADMWRMRNDIVQARDLAWEFGWGGMYEAEEVDLYDFAAQYAAFNTDPVLGQILQDLMDSVDSAVLAEFHGVLQLRCHGLSIYFPDNKGDYTSRYGTASLDFAAHAGWDEFLDLYLNYTVPVALQGYASYWRADHAVITWTMKDADPAGLSFNVYRRADPSGFFDKIYKPDIVRNGGEYRFHDYSTKNGENYTYRVEIVEGSAVIASFETDVQTPAPALALLQNHPNPFNPATEIGFVIPEDGHVVLDVFDVSGKRVRVLADEIMPAGRHARIWDGRSDGGEHVASGLYFYRLAARKRTITQKCVLLR